MPLFLSMPVFFSPTNVPGVAVLYRRAETGCGHRRTAGQQSPIFQSVGLPHFRIFLMSHASFLQGQVNIPGEKKGAIYYDPDSGDDWDDDDPDDDLDF